MTRDLRAAAAQRPWLFARSPRIAVLAAVVIASAALPLVAARSDADDLHSLEATVSVRARGIAVPKDFVGFSFEYGGLARWAGDGSRPVDPLLVRLIALVSPAPVIRVGGNSSDESRWAVRGAGRSPAFRHLIGPDWMRHTAALVRALHARLVLGLNLAADRPALAVEMARAAVQRLPRGSLAAFELGNEPDLYGIVPWYQTIGRSVNVPPAFNRYARRRRYRFLAFLRDYGRFARALRGAGLTVPLAGPSWGTPRWQSALPRFVRDQRAALGLVTVHRYPLRTCHVTASSPEAATVANLLGEQASAGLAARLGPAIAAARRAGMGLRVDELNSVSCGGRHRVGDSFATALWATDTLFELLRAGVAGVNFHARPHTYYSPFYIGRRNGRWVATVKPEYYGLLLFARATAGGARLLPVAADGDPRIKVWALRGADGDLRVVVLNKQRRDPAHVVLTLPGRRAAAGVELLLAPAANALERVTLAGQSFRRATTRIAFSGTLTRLRALPYRGAYRITLPAASGGLVEVPARG